MGEIAEYLENPTISKITQEEKNKYQMSRITVMDLLKRIENLEREITLLKFANAGLDQRKTPVFYEEDNDLEGKNVSYEIEQDSHDAIPTKSDISLQNEVKIGENVIFGKFRGKDIEWQILDINKEDNSVLLITKHLLFKKKFNEGYGICTWEVSTLRKYLNNEFYTNTFSEEEKRKIKEVSLNNAEEDYREKGISFNETKDKVFILSIDEVNRYFETIKEKIATYKSRKKESYWLRSPDLRLTGARYVRDDGFYTYDNNHLAHAVRPALWINL